MKKVRFFLLIILFFSTKALSGQQGGDTIVYLITCGPGTEMYSVYGHSAIRIVYNEQKLDLVYNWGVFDFDTPNFGLKFARGKLEYMLAVEPMRNFLQAYFYEKRYVQSQKINLSPGEISVLAALINENLKPENVRYRYDFFYDNCSTRIRDMLEKAVGRKLLYIPEPGGIKPTFRSMVSKYQMTAPWLKFGIDLLLGAPVDKGASYRERMFLPIDLQAELSETHINRDGKMIPLLQNPDQILDEGFTPVKTTFLLSPSAIFGLLFILVMIFSGVYRQRRFIQWMDITIFSVFSILALLMLFFNFVSGHPQLKQNLNMIWLNPLIVVCLAIIVFKGKGATWFSILSGILALFLAVHFLLPQSFNPANLPLVLILLIRSSARAGFSWNPLNIAT